MQLSMTRSEWFLVQVALDWYTDKVPNLPKECELLRNKVRDMRLAADRHAIVVHLPADCWIPEGAE